MDGCSGPRPDAGGIDSATRTRGGNYAGTNMQNSLVGFFTLSSFNSHLGFVRKFKMFQTSTV